MELAVLDKAGRLQIPKEYLEALGMSGKNKIRVEAEGNRIILLNPDEIG
jgi:bifunctional DNA-binding transcriptional regulator/antitoxin component of YhaV-PrlF toxin-antitoxin module